MSAKKNKKRDGNTTVISFKVAPEIHDKIKDYAKTQKDEAGLTLSVSLAARRLMLESLSKLKK